MLKLLTYLLPALLKALKPEMLQSVVDTLLDKVEKLVEESPNKIDDLIVLPLVKIIRDTFNIPDNDDKDIADSDRPA